MKRDNLKNRLKELCINEHHFNYACELLPAVKKAIGGKNGKIYAQVNTVSRSGARTDCIISYLTKVKSHIREI